MCPCMHRVTVYVKIFEARNFRGLLLQTFRGNNLRRSRVSSTQYILKFCELNFHGLLGSAKISKITRLENLDVYGMIALYHFPFIHFPAGLNFWKTGSRKVFCVAEEELGLRSMSVRQKRPSRATVSSDSDDFTDDEPYSHPKRRPSGGINQEILEEVRSIRQDITTLAQQTRLTPELRRHLADAFKCQICQDIPMKPPIVSTGCCKRLLGCQACMEEVYIQHPLDPTCPLCRRPSETSVFRGLDEFLIAVAGLMEDSDSTMPNPTT